MLLVALAFSGQGRDLHLKKEKGRKNGKAKPLKKVLFFYILRALTTITYDDDDGDDDALNEWATLFLLGNITRTSADIVKGLMAAAISPFVGPILFYDEVNERT